MSTWFFPAPSPEDEAPDAGTAYIIPKKEISMVPDMGKWKRSQVRFLPVETPRQKVELLL